MNLGPRFSMCLRKFCIEYGQNQFSSSPITENYT